MLRNKCLGLLVAGLALLMSTSAGAFPPPESTCDASNEGAQTSTSHESGYIVWECRSGSWMFVLQYECDPYGNCIPM